ncbi:MAG: TIGR00268 family protein, partial [Dehalococcoidia bacterium]
KPTMACLSSRIPYGTSVTVETLRQIEAAEVALREMGFRQLRVRHHQNLARIEVPLKDFPRLLEVQEEVVHRLREAGYTYVTLDMAGFRSGSLNEVLYRTRGRSQGVQS